MTRKLALMTFAGLALASAASAQTLSTLNLTDGLFRYAETGLTATGNRTGSGGGSANFGFIGTNTTVGNTTVASDYLFQNWWWYRSAGDTREFALSNQTLGTALGANSAFLRYVEPIGGNATANGTLTFEFTYTLNQISATQASVTINWGITNNSNSDQSVNFFAYADSDMGFTSLSDDDGSYTATGVANYYRNNNSTSDSARFFVMAADLRLNDRWQIGPFSTTNTNAPLANLANGVLNNLPNLDSTGGPADNSGAFQFSDMVIPAGGSLGGRITKGYNILVPTPGAAALLGLGALVIGRRRRA